MHSERTGTGQLRSDVWLKRYVIGELQETAKASPRLEAFREMRLGFEQQGLFNATFRSNVGYGVEVTLILLSLILSVWFATQDGLVNMTISLVSYATAQIQCYWFVHDLGHNAMLSTPQMNWMWNKICWSTLLGAPATMWNASHNKHHAKTNIHGKDPSANVGKMAAFDLEQLEHQTHKGSSHHMRYQHLYFFPGVFILGFLRLRAVANSLKKNANADEVV